MKIKIVRWDEVLKIHKDNRHFEEYKIALQLIDTHARIWTLKEAK
jgi:hypothetical protein